MNMNKLSLDGLPGLNMAVRGGGGRLRVFGGVRRLFVRAGRGYDVLVLGIVAGAAIGALSGGRVAAMGVQVWNRVWALLTG